MHPEIGCMTSQVEKWGNDGRFVLGPKLRPTRTAARWNWWASTALALSSLLSCDVVVGAATGRLIGYAWLNARWVWPAEQPRFSHAFQPRRFSLLFHFHAACLPASAEYPVVGF